MSSDLSLSIRSPKQYGSFNQGSQEYQALELENAKLRGLWEKGTSGKLVTKAEALNKRLVLIEKRGSKRCCVAFAVGFVLGAITVVVAIVASGYRIVED